MEVTPEVVDLIEKIQKKITDVPGSYNQETYAESVEPSQAPCGTAACIAGWALLLSGKYVAEPKPHGDSLRFVTNDTNRDETSPWEAAKGLLGLNADEAYALFNVTPDEAWPYEFADRWMESKTDAELARVANDYLEHIKTTGDVCGAGCYGDSSDDEDDDWDDDDDDDDDDLMSL